jgi:hypothetical protein
VNVANPHILHMPMKHSLKLVPIIRSYGLDPEWEFANDIANQLVSILLGVAVIDFKGADSGGIVDGCILESLYQTPSGLAEL